MSGVPDPGDVGADSVFESTVRGEVCRLSRPGTRWLSTGYAGGESVADAAYLLSVPEGWADVDVSGYVRRRLREVGFGGDRSDDDRSGDDRAGGNRGEGRSDDDGDAAPALLTGVSMRHARRARLGPVEAVVTAGVSNPAALPMAADGRSDRNTGGQRGDRSDGDGDRRHAGTVNVVVGTTRSLAPGALANLVAVAAEAKAATLLDRTGFPGTTSDAVLVGCDPGGEPAAFSGSATEVGSAARACVRDALLAALESRYVDEAPPGSVTEAEYGVVTDERADVEAVVDE
ncbi:adenosylcobinamide amidohydrolase [Halobellus limi]|uniref:Adenosylcobinamide amidohydrolase n=1 Tax=Halobellus limi TaxID=699433 RepID=A0A1H5YM36_9EURY|nr:adenosylcobinamide amidohydrolase [Halobellus limi]SEG24645.1 adenosylcobinamide hydrolase [Halobellus limi]